MPMLSWRRWIEGSRVRGNRFRAGRRSAGMPVSERALRLAAEVLEPRCLLTDSAGVEFTRSGQTVVVPASQWSDDGLTLFVMSDAFEIRHTDASVMTVIPFESVSRLVLQGRNQAADDLSIQFHASPGERVPTIEFDGGVGSQPDRLRFAYWQIECQIEPKPNRSGLISLVESVDAIESGVEAWMLSYRDVEWVRDQSQSDHRVVQFGSENNVVTLSPKDEFGFSQLIDLTTDAVIETEWWSEINGGAGNDRITAIDVWIDSIHGQSGNDTLIAGDYSSELFGGDGADWLVGNWLYGEAGNDTLDGTTASDELHGGTGNDLLRGGDDHDTLFGEFGNDTLEGGGYSDSLFGGDGDDVLRGGDGDDSMAGDVGNDSLEGDAGTDLLYGGYDRDAVDRVSDESVLEKGDSGRDTLRGGDDNDELYGDAGNDSLFGDGGEDYVYGGLGNDKLDGGDDGDELRGEEGNDSLFGGNGHDRLYETWGLNLLDGGAGNDDLAIEWDELALMESNTLLGQAGNDSLQGGQGNDLLSGGDGRDTLSGELGRDTLRGDAGNDSLDGGEGSDLLDGGSERDELRDEYEQGNNTLLGGTGNDSLTVNGDGSNALDGGAGHDRLEGGYGNDKLLGGDGHDLLIGREGADRLDGGADRDKLFGQSEGDFDDSDPGDRLLNGELTADESWDFEDSDIDLDAEATIETIITATDWTDGGLTVWWNNGRLFVSRTDTDEVIFETTDSSSTNRWRIQGRDNATDRLTVRVSLGSEDYYEWSLPAVLFDGSGGADQLRLVGDTPWMQFEPRHDRSGWVRTANDGRTSPTDQPLISYRNVELVQDDANAEAKSLQFGSDNNDVEYNRVPDTKFVEVTDRATGNVLRLTDPRRYISVGMGAGNDRLDIRDPNLKRNFYLNGETGNDTLRLLESGDGQYELYGGDGDDSLQGNSGGDYLCGSDGNDTLNGMGGTDFLDGDEGNDLLLGGDDNDELRGSAGNNTLLGEGGDDYLIGDEGDELLDGGNGDDQLVGAQGNDTLRGGRGNDWLYGDDGANLLEGGSGDDDLRIYYGDDYDGPDDQLWSNTLLGQAGHDMLRGGCGNDLLSGGDGQDLLDGRAGNDTLRGDANPDQLDGGVGNDLLDGGDARDILNDSDGDDTLLGGAANDWLGDGVGNNLFDGGSGHDQLIAGDGRDTLRGGDGDDSLAGGDNADWLDGGAGQDWLDGHYAYTDNNPGDRLLNGEQKDDGVDDWSEAETNIDWDMELTTVTLVTAADWGDSGLTLSYFYDDGWQIHVRHTGSSEDLIEPFEPSLFDRYVIQGRDHRHDVLTLDMTEGAAEELHDLVFAGGLGDNDELRLIGEERLSPFADLTIQPGRLGLRPDLRSTLKKSRDGVPTYDGSISWGIQDFTGGATPSLMYSNVATLVISVRADTTTIQFGDEANNIVLDGSSPDGLWRLSDSVTRTSMQLLAPLHNETLIVQAGGGNDRVSLRPAAFVEEDFNLVVRVLGDAGDDTITGHLGNSSLFGGTGNDSLIGDGGFDELWGDEGNDTLIGLGGDDWLVGGDSEDGNDLLLGGEGNDDLFGGSGIDTLDGMGGDDWLSGEDGDDLLFSGDGIDDLIDDGHDQLFQDDTFSQAERRKQQLARTRSRPEVVAMPKIAVMQDASNTVTDHDLIPVVSRSEEFVNDSPDFFVLVSSWPNAPEIDLTEVVTASSPTMTSVVEVSDDEPLDSTEPRAADMLLERLDPADIDQLLSDAELLDGLM